MNFSPDKSSAKAKKRIRKDVLLKSVLEAASDDAQEIEEGPLIPKVSRSLSRSIANSAKRRNSHLKLEVKKMETISPAKIEKSEDKEEEDPSITDRLQQLERHILAIPTSNPALPTMDSIDIVNMIASENIAPKWERQFHRSALIVAANAYEEYMVDIMLPLIFDDIGIPEEQRAAVLERIQQQRATTRSHYFANYGAEMDKGDAKPAGEAGSEEQESE